MHDEILGIEAREELEAIVVDPESMVAMLAEMREAGMFEVPAPDEELPRGE